MGSTASILPPTAANLDACAEILRQGNVLALPTETVYGLAGNALRESSARKIFEVKGRPLIDPLIVHFHDANAAEAHIETPPCFQTLAEAFWPGPLTLVVQKKPSIPDLITAGLNSVAVRVPRHPLFRAVLERLNFPLAAPSANPFGYVSPTLASHVATTLGHKIPAILDGGACDFGLESTILDIRDPGNPVILRQGPITEQQISKILGRPAGQPIQHTQNDNTAQAAPGLLTKHYSPTAEVYVIPHGAAPASAVQVSGDSTALVLNQKPAWDPIAAHTYWLSESGALSDIAHSLFALLQRLDQLGYRQIRIERPPDHGIGKAINDRLSRAAAKSTMR